MAFPYVPAFLALLAVYLVYSAWAGLDSRIPIAGGLLLLLATAIVAAGGATAVANSLSDFVFFLIVGGVILLFVDHVRASQRDRRERPGGSGLDGRHPDPSEASQERKGSTEKSLERSE